MNATDDELSSILSAASDKELEDLLKGSSPPGAFASFGAGAVERGRQLYRGAQQMGARAGIAGPEDTSAYDPAAVERGAKEWEQNVLIPENQRADITNQPYQKSHPWAYGLGGMTADVALTAPLAFFAPELSPMSLAGRVATLGGLGALQGGLLGLAEPVRGGNTPEQYASTKALQALMGAGIGGVAAPLMDVGIRGGIAAAKGAGRWLGRKVGLVPEPAMSPGPAEMAATEHQYGKPGLLTLGELSGDPAMIRRESNLEYLTGSGMPAFREQQYNKALDIANRLRQDSGSGLPGNPGSIVADELNGNLSAVRFNAQKNVEGYVNRKQPPDVISPDRGVKEGLENELATRRAEAGKLYSQVNNTAKELGVTGSAIPTPNTMRETKAVLQEINPDTWRSLASPRLTATLNAIKDGINDTTRFESMPLENLMEVAQSAADRAAARFPDQAAAVNPGTSRADFIKAIGEYNRLATANPAEILGPRPAGVQGMLYAIKQLGGLKIDYMGDAIGESSKPKSIMPGLFTKNGRSPDDLARALQEQGFPVDDSLDGVDHLFEYIRRNVAGEKTVSINDAANFEAQRQYNNELNRALSAPLPEQWMPGQALDFAGMRRLKQDLGDFYGKAVRANGGISSQESRAFARLMSALDRDTQNWADSSGSTKLVKQLNTANKYHETNIATYFRTETPEVTKVIGNNEADRARVSLFRNDSPELAENVMGMMTPAGQQSAKWGIWQDALSSATQSGKFDPSSFLGYFDKNSGLLKTVFNQADWNEVRTVSNYLSNLKIDKGVESAVNRAIETGDTDALLSQFSKANKPLLAQRITDRLRTPESRQAVESWLIDNAYNKAFDERNGILSLKRFTGELAKYGEIFNQVSSPERVNEIKGVMLLLDRAAAASQYLQNPRTGVQLMPMIRSYGPTAVLGGMVGGYLSPDTSPSGRAMGAAAGAMGAGALGPIIMRKLLTEPAGRALAQRLGAMSTSQADQALQSPGYQNLLTRLLLSVSAVGASRGAQGMQSQTEVPR